MARYIVCRQCGEDSKLNPRDSAQGWKMRKVFLSCQRPEGHGLTINGEFHALSDVICDQCGQPVTGQVVIAITHSPPGREIGPWEQEFGQVLSAEAVKASDTLSK